jgi:hypothetical protein
VQIPVHRGQSFRRIADKPSCGSRSGRFSRIAVPPAGSPVSKPAATSRESEHDISERDRGTKEARQLVCIGPEHTGYICAQLHRNFTGRPPLSMSPVAPAGAKRAVPSARAPTPGTRSTAGRAPACRQRQEDGDRVCVDRGSPRSPGRTPRSQIAASPIGAPSARVLTQPGPNSDRKFGAFHGHRRTTSLTTSSNCGPKVGAGCVRFRSKSRRAAQEARRLAVRKPDLIWSYCPAVQNFIAFLLSA